MEERPKLGPLPMTFRRDRHGWKPGYFDELRGVRIPFPWRDGSPLTGVLTVIEETEHYIGLTFEDVRPDEGEEGDDGDDEPDGR